MAEKTESLGHDGRKQRVTIPDDFVILSSEKVVSTNRPIECSITFGPARLPQMLSYGVSLDLVREVGVEKAETIHNEAINSLRSQCITIQMTHFSYSDLVQFCKDD